MNQIEMDMGIETPGVAEAIMNALQKCERHIHRGLRDVRKNITMRHFFTQLFRYVYSRALSCILPVS